MGADGAPSHSPIGELEGPRGEGVRLFKVTQNTGVGWRIHTSIGSLFWLL